MQQHRVEEGPKGYPNPPSKRSGQLEKCPLSAAQVFTKNCATLIMRATLLPYCVRHFSRRRAILEKCRATFLKKACDTLPVSYNISQEGVWYFIVSYDTTSYGRAILLNCHTMRINGCPRKSGNADRQQPTYSKQRTSTLGSIRST